jgi:hypothetical protein
VIKSAWYFIISALFIFLLIGCAQWGGDNPLGITGGSKEGYGQNRDLNFPDTTQQKTIDPELLGIWNSINTNSWTSLTFYANGDFNIRSYSDGTIYDSDGTYYTYGKTIILILDGKTNTSSYSIIMDRLIITIDGERMVFYRDHEQ